LVRDFLAERGFRGSVIDERWQNFAYNRTFALEALRKVPDIDYALMIDADDRLIFTVGFDVEAFKSVMHHDFYDIEVRHGSMRHFRPQLCSNKLSFSYRGVLHEFLQPPPGELSRGTAAGFYVEIIGGGARSGNPAKYQIDAMALEKALVT